MTRQSLRATGGGLLYNLRADWNANPRDPKARFVLVGFRIVHALAGEGRPRVRSWPGIVIYRFVTEWLLGIELRPTTRVGPGLTVFHGFGLVVNDHAILGSGVKLRNGVVIGNKVPSGACPRIGDEVEIGANATIIGDIEVGAHAVIGAGAVVTKSVPFGAVVAGNPARVLKSRD